MELISLIIPSFNEQENIPNTIKTLSDILSKEDFDYELLFINDGSKDSTYDEILKASKEDPHVKGI